MCLLCKPNMKMRDRPCMRKYSRQDIEIWEEQAKQREFERRLKKARAK